MTKASASKLNQTDRSSGTATTATGIRPRAMEILEGRGLDIELLTRLGVRSTLSAKLGEEAIEIPFMDEQGNEVNVKTRTIEGPKKFFQKPDARKLLYNIQAIKEWKESKEPLLICEGELDAITAIQCGYFAVSVPDGAPAEPIEGETKKYEYLKDIPPGGVIILCTDGDAPGVNLMNDLAIRLGRHRCKWVKYPKGCKDLNDALKAYGDKAVHETVKRAEWFEVSGLYTMSELAPLEMPEFKECVLPIKIRKTDLWVITGIPGMGKTTLTNFLAHEEAEQGWRVCFASFEQRPQTMHKRNLRSLMLGGRPEDASPEDVARVDKEIDERFSFIVSSRADRGQKDLAWLMEKMAAAVTRKGADAFVIDPFNQMEHALSHGEKMSDYISFMLSECKYFAEDYNVNVKIVAHPTKQAKGKDGKIPMPTLYDIEDSRHWWGKADVGVIVHLDEYGNTIARVAKTKDHDLIGSPGDYTLGYNTQTKAYERSLYA